MKIILQKVDKGKEEVIIRYNDMTHEISEVLRTLSGSDVRLAGTKEDGRQVYHFLPGEVFYFESVDGAVYAYLEKEVYRLRERLEDILCRYEYMGIVRCARTMAVNLFKVEWFESRPGGRILAVLQNGEKIVISRRYAGILRQQLKNGGGGR